MYNLTKMELYKLFKSVSLWVMLAVVIAFGAFNAWATSVDISAMRDEDYASEFFESQNIIEQGEYVESEMNIGIYFDTQYEWLYEAVNIGDFTVVFLQSGVYLVFISIFAAIFANSEYKNGYIKNIAGQITYKGKLVLAKLPALLIFNIIIYVLCYLTNIIFVRIFIGEIDLSISANFIKLALIQLLLHFAFSCLIMALTSLIRSQAFGMTFGIIFSTGLGSLLYTGINTVVNKLNDGGTFDIGKYTIVQNVNSIGTSFDFSNAARILTVGILFVLISAGAALIVTNKRDVK